MSAQLLPPNPSLVAIILIIKTRQGVKHIYHYPPDPGRDKPHVKLDYEHSSEEGSSSSEASYSSVEDDPHWPSDGEGKGENRDDTSLDDSASASPDKKPAWDGVTRSPKELLGLPLGFASFLCPPATYHKKRFELSVDQLTFLGWPCFARENGDWKKRRSKSIRDQRRKMSTISEQKPGETLAKKTLADVDEELGETTGHESVDEKIETEIDLATNEESGKLDASADADRKEAASPSVGHGLSMFHVILVMNPPPLEYQIRVDEMYRHVVKKFSRALKWEQARSNYVLRECEKLKSMKARHDPASPEVLRSSTLAKAIATLYTSISTSRIAHIDLSPHLSFSLQIPIPTSISHLPDATSPQLPGLWLTTSTSIPTHDELTTTRSKLASHFALLLLSDLPTILSELASTSPLAAPLAHYLRCTSPTKSFLQISQSSGIPLDDIYFLTSHLIYWRRARAIPPLHQRDVYIVSPNADMRKLRSASNQFARLFPALPSLPKILGSLSSGNRPYGAIIPNKDHKAAYMAILAWLMRGGWVTQLRTFAWVRVPERVQAAVAAEAEREKKTRERDRSKSKGKEKEKEPHPSSSRGDDGNESEAGDAPPPGSTASSGYLTPMHSSIHSLAPSTTSSHSSARTAIPLGGGSGGAAYPHVHPPMVVTESLISSAAALKAFRPRLLLQPIKASGVEKRFLDLIMEEVERGEGKEVAEAWERCLGFFDGEHALEDIAIREGWKRKKVEGFRAAWGRVGVLVEVRHW